MRSMVNKPPVIRDTSSSTEEETRFSGKNLVSNWRLIKRLTSFPRPGCQGSLQVKQWLPLALFAFGLVCYVISPSEVTASLTIGLASILAISYLWARSLALKLDGKRVLHFTALQLGDELEEYITLTNHSNLPALWVEFVDRSHIPGYTVSSVRAADPHSTSEWRAHTTCTQRGIFTLGPWEMVTGDPLGIFSVTLVFTQTEEILVYPPLSALPPALLPHRQKVGDNRPLRQPLVSETIDALTTRPYVPGDPLHRIHWRTTARLDAPYVKTFEPESSSTVWLIPDFDTAVQLGEGNDSTVENMVVLLASLSAQLLQERLAVGLFAYTDTTHLVMPQRGQAHLWALLRALAPLQPAGVQPFSQTLSRAQALVAGQGLMVAVTPSLDSEWPKMLRRMAYSRGALNTEAILFDRPSFGGVGEAEPFVQFLAEIGIPGRVVHFGDLHPISGTYGELRRWEFMTLGTGRVVVRRAPRRITETLNR